MQPAISTAPIAAGKPQRAKKPGFLSGVGEFSGEAKVVTFSGSCCRLSTQPCLFAVPPFLTVALPSATIKSLSQPAAQGLGCRGRRNPCCATLLPENLTGRP